MELKLVKEKEIMKIEFEQINKKVNMLKKLKDKFNIRLKNGSKDSNCVGEKNRNSFVTI